MPKKFIFFLGTAQSILTLLFFLSFEAAIIFFPGLQPWRTAVLTAQLLLSFSFLTFSVLSRNRDNFFLRWGYIFASVWLVFVFYFLIASVLALAVFAIFGLPLSIAGMAALGLSIAITLYGIINARVTRVISINVSLSNLPAFWRGKTAVMASDLHLGQVLRKGFAHKVIRLINKQNPEVVFIPGDFYDGVHADFPELANEFKKIAAPLGIYFCSGNHEMFAGYEKCERALKGAGIKILENQKTEINGLQIAGVAYKQETMPDLPQTLASLGLDRNKPSILLKHVPLQLAEIEAAGVSLVLCGHSHQGQIWPGRLITKRYFKGFDYGFKKLGNMLTYTSSGAGTWGPPMRVFTKSEIIKIIFQ